MKKFQRTRSLTFWHDHSTILGAGYILMSVHIVFDPAVHVDYEKQNEIEEPHIYMLCMSSSSSADQLATIPDHVDCLQELDQPIYSENGIAIHDKLRFFIGDHPAQSFERGCQIGGLYKCGCCGCKSNRMDDLPHALRCNWRSLQDLQYLVLAGKYGNKAGVMKPFESLTSAELKEELLRRGVFNVALPKKDSIQQLCALFKGAQRVPSLLIMNPSKSLKEMRLNDYEILDSEPLHVLKGHFINLLTRIPYLLHGDSLHQCKELLESVLFSKKQNGYSGRDFRIAAVQVYKFLYAQVGVQKDVKVLMATIVKISELLYASCKTRTPKTVLQLYNCTWLHHTLCRKLFDQSRLKNVTWEAFLGTYLHSLVCHAPKQYELICLRSVNTENQERLFQQAKAIAKNCSNRKPNNVITSIVLSLQAKNLTGKMSNIYASANTTEVKKAFLGLPTFEGTLVSFQCIDDNAASWQAHLEQISSFLTHGEGVWWKKTDDGIKFSDADSDQDFYECGPSLLHFRTTTLKDISLRKIDKLNEILLKNIPIPAKNIMVYDANGDVLNTQSTETACTSTNDIVSPIIGTPVRSASKTTFENTPSRYPSFFSSTPIQSSENNLNSEQNADLSIPPDETTDEDTCTNTIVSISLPEIIDKPSKNSSSHSNSREWKTKHGLAIYRVLGSSKELVNFDNLHFLLKQKQKENKLLNKDECEKYKELLAILQQEILQIKTEVRKQILKIEKCSFQQKSHLPSPQESEHAEIYQNYKNIKYFLRMWNITL